MRGTEGRGKGEEGEGGERRRKGKKNESKPGEREK